MAYGGQPVQGQFVGSQDSRSGDSANLADANLTGADLSRTDLRGAEYDAKTQWHEAFHPAAAGVVRGEWPTRINCSQKFL